MFTMVRSIVRNLSHPPATRLYPMVKRPPLMITRCQPNIDPAACAYCTVCAKRCPSGALTVTRKPQPSWTLDPFKCISCGYCAESCPKKCLTVDQQHVVCR